MSARSGESGVRGSRRGFLKSPGALAAGMVVTPAVQARGKTVERLALNGGPKAVTVSDADAWRWPRYGKAEEEAVLALVRRVGASPRTCVRNRHALCGDMGRRGRNERGN